MPFVIDDVLAGLLLTSQVRNIVGTVKWAWKGASRLVGGGSSSKRELAVRNNAEVARLNADSAMKVAEYNATVEAAKLRGQRALQLQLAQMDADQRLRLQRDAQSFEVSKQRDQQEHEISMEQKRQQHEKSMALMRHDFDRWLQENELEFRQWLAEKQSRDAFELLRLERQYDREELWFRHQNDLDLWQTQNADQGSASLPTSHPL